VCAFIRDEALSTAYALFSAMERRSGEGYH
jgi:hypothetical protein